MTKEEKIALLELHGWEAHDTDGDENNPCRPYITNRKIGKYYLDEAWHIDNAEPNEWDDGPLLSMFFLPIELLTDQQILELISYPYHGL